VLITRPFFVELQRQVIFILPDEPDAEVIGRHSASLLHTGKKRGSSQQNCAIGKTQHRGLDCRYLACLSNLA
jgi:hypothetical protein